jgi:hypothetical protein
MREFDLSNARWRKSTYSGGDGGRTASRSPTTSSAPPAGARAPTAAATAGDCLEVADGVPGVVPVRDSKVPDGPVLLIGADAWLAFVGGLGR